MAASTFSHGASLPRAHAAAEDHHVGHLPREGGGQLLQVLATLGQHHRRAPSGHRGDDVIDDELVPLVVGDERGVERLDRDARICLAAGVGKARELGAADQDAVLERPSNRLGPVVDSVADRSTLHEDDGL